MAEYLDKIRQIKEDRKYDRAQIDVIANEMEEILGPAEMWNYLRYGFTTDEFIENLEYIAKEADI